MTRLVKWIAVTLTAASLTWLNCASAAAPAASAESETFQLTSTAAPAKGMIPTVYTCSGKGISPPLVWSGAPAGTQGYALIVSDPDAPSRTFYHWVWYDIPRTTTELPEGATPPNGTLVGVSSSNQHGYSPPCPPPGHTHRYIFSLYALNAKVGVGAGADAGTVMGAMQSHVIGMAEYVMTFKR